MENDKNLKYKIFSTHMSSKSDLETYLNSLDGRYEVISVVQPCDTHHDGTWQFLIITKYYINNDNNANS